MSSQQGMGRLRGVKTGPRTFPPRADPRRARLRTDPRTGPPRAETEVIMLTLGVTLGRARLGGEHKSFM